MVSKGFCWTARYPSITVEKGPHARPSDQSRTNIRRIMGSLTVGENVLQGVDAVQDDGT
jgi:hypothetical protein